jgi:Na+-driven multidrug efflux pump
MISFAGISVSYVYGTLLTAHGSLKPLIIFAIGSVVLNVILNLFLIPQFKALGSAIASMITQLLMAGLQIIYAQKLFQFRINVGLILKFLSLIVIGMVLALVLKKTGLAWAISFVAIIFVMGLVAMISGLLKPSRLISILAAEQVD